MSRQRWEWTRWHVGRLLLALAAVCAVSGVVLMALTGGGLGPDPTRVLDPSTSFILTMGSFAGAVAFFVLSTAFPLSLSPSEVRTLADEAEKLGLTYVGHDKTPELAALAKRLQPGQDFRSRHVDTTITRLMSGDRRSEAVKVFDYVFTITGGQHRNWRSYRCALVDAPLRMSAVAIRPRQDRVRGGGLFGAQPSGTPWGTEVDLRDDGFRSAFEARADDVEIARALIGEKLQAWLVAHGQGESFLAGDGIVLCMRPADRAASHRELLEHLLRFRDEVIRSTRARAQ